MRMKRIHRVMMSRESNGKVAELGSQEGWRQVIYLTHPLDPGLEHCSIPLGRYRVLFPQCKTAQAQTLSPDPVRS